MTYLSDNIALVRANTFSTAFDSGIVDENTVDSYANLLYPYLLDNGGNTNNISLTIDILNKKELEQETKNFVNKNWVNPDRLENNLSVSKPIWGFKECYHGTKKSRAISNAFGFSGQQLTFYIAPQGHGTGYIDDEWVYTKTSISISATNITNNTNEVLYTFDDFEKEDSDTSRYFNWTVPSIDDAFFSQYGLFGLVVLKIDVTQSFYKDANWEKPLDKDIPFKNQAYLQLLVYSGAKEIIEVNGGLLNILTSTPSYTDSLEQIFSHTIFESLQSLNQNPLTAAQKRAIIADQIAVLFISQHPVLTADFVPGKILGAGANQALPPRKVIEKAIIYSRRYPDIIPMVNDRLFGMLATYKAFDFVVDIEKYFTNFTQSSQQIRDPARTIYIDSNGVINDDLGVDGVIFNPYIIEVINAETILNVPDPIPIDIVLQDGIVDIENIQITNASGGEILPHSYSAKVTFDVTFGSENIYKIRYSVMTKEGLNYQSYTDSNVLSRSYTFVFDNQIIPKPSKKGDVVIAQIDIEDVDGGVSSFIRSVPLYGYTPLPLLYDLKIYQRREGGTVDMEYSYSGLGEINNSYLYVQFSSDKGSTWSTIPTTSLKGDFGSNVQPGRRKVTWKPLIDLSNVSVSYPILCRLTMYDVDNNLSKYETITGALVKDLVKPDVAVMKKAQEKGV